MSNYLTRLGKKHKQWISYVCSFGCNPDTAEDLVQEMYLTVNDYSNRTGKNINDFLYKNTGEINFYFIYVILKRMFLDLKRKEVKVNVIDIKNIDLSEEEGFIYSKLKGTKVGTLVLENKQEQDEIYLKHKVIEDYLLNDDFLELTTEGKIEDYDIKKFGAFYKRKLFEEVFIKGQSIRQFSKESGIGYYSVYNTIRNIKKELNEKYKTRRLNSDNN